MKEKESEGVRVWSPCGLWLEAPRPPHIPPSHSFPCIGELDFPRCIISSELHRKPTLQIIQRCEDCENISRTARERF